MDSSTNYLLRYSPSVIRYIVMLWTRVYNEETFKFMYVFLLLSSLQSETVLGSYARLVKTYRV